VLTSLSEARRLVTHGFTPHEVAQGLARVVDERAHRRDELRADSETRRRRTATIRWGAALLVVGLALVVVAFHMRIPEANGMYGNTPAGITLVMSGMAMMGTSFVLLIKSPFRMPPGERLFRLVWLGPIGRGFVRLAGRRVASANAGTTIAPTRRPSAPSHAAVRPVTQAPVTQAPVAAPPTAPVDRLDALEARVAALERGRGPT
jgi:hypothetical protein